MFLHRTLFLIVAWTYLAFDSKYLDCFHTLPYNNECILLELQQIITVWSHLLYNSLKINYPFCKLVKLFETLSWAGVNQWHHSGILTATVYYAFVGLDI